MFAVKASAFCCAFALNLDNFIRTPSPGPARGSDAMTRFGSGERAKGIPERGVRRRRKENDLTEYLKGAHSYDLFD